ncbi:hypothetical protein PG984_011978 [Apiospora sp. TS-2023a]
MDDVKDVREREEKFHALWAQFEEGRLNPPRASEMERLGKLQKDQEEALAQVKSSVESMDKEEAELRASIANLKDEKGKFDAQKVQSQSRLEQARFDHLLVIAGASPNDSLDLVRGISDEHKNALFNYEAEMLKQQLADAQAALASAKAELASGNAKLIPDPQNDLSGANELLSSLRLENSDLKQKVADSDRDLAERVGELVSMQLERDDVSQQLEAQKESARKYRKELGELHSDNFKLKKLADRGQAIPASSAKAKLPESPVAYSKYGGEDVNLEVQNQDSPRKRQRRIPAYKAGGWDKFCDDVHDFLFHHRMILEPVSAQTSGLTITQAGDYLVQVANTPRAQDNLTRFDNEAEPNEWYCFKRVVERGLTAPGAMIDCAEPCAEHPNDGDVCFQIMRGDRYRDMVVQLQY